MMMDVWSLCGGKYVDVPYCGRMGTHCAFIERMLCSLSLSLSLIVGGERIK